MKTYSNSIIEELIEIYIDQYHGEMTELQEGVLGYGVVLLTAPNKQHAIIRERYVNEWSSTHTIRFYKQLPKKYQLLQEALCNEM